MGLVREGMAQHGTAVFASVQTAGKGQRNKQWIAAPGENIAISVILEPFALSKTGLFVLSMTMAVGTLRFFKKYIAEECSIKWPNDLYWRDRKAGGILIENVWQGSNWKYAIAGIGININQTSFGELSQKAVSLKQITGNQYIPIQLARELCGELETAFQEALISPVDVIKEYTENLYQRNQIVKLKKGARVFEAEIINVTTSGQLVVHHATEEKFDVGEVEWLF